MRGTSTSTCRRQSASGLDTVSGGTGAMLDHVWAGASQRVNPSGSEARWADRRTDFDELTAYSALIQFTPADSLTIGVERTFGFAAISPRTVSLGLTLLSHRAQLDWVTGSTLSPGARRQLRHPFRREYALGALRLPPCSGGAHAAAESRPRDPDPSVRRANRTSTTATTIHAATNTTRWSRRPIGRHRRTSVSRCPPASDRSVMTRAEASRSG